MDYNKDTYTIVSVDKDMEGSDALGHICVKFDFDDSTQCLSGAPTGSVEDLKAFVTDYLVAYKQGKRDEEEAALKPASEKVADLVGKQQTAKTD